MKKAASENFLDSIQSKHENSSNSLLGKSRFNTPGRSEDNILAAYSNSHILSTGAGTGTPGRIKKFCKRVRRRSVEIFSIKKEERDRKDEEVACSSKSTDHLAFTSSSSQQDVRGIKSMFGGSTQRKIKGNLKKSVSTPSLSTTRRKNSTSDDSDGDFSKRKLSFNSEVNSCCTENGDDVTSFEGGLVNNAFVDNAAAANTAEYSAAVVVAKTPVIRKALCPSSVRTPRHDLTKEKRNSDLLQSIENTPKIMKPKEHRTVTGGGGGDGSGNTDASSTSTSIKLKAKKGIRVSGQFKRLTSFSKRVGGGGSGASQQQQTSTTKTSKEKTTKSRSNENKENIYKVTGL